MLTKDNIIFNIVNILVVTLIPFPQIIFSFRISSIPQSYPCCNTDNFNLYSKINAQDTVELSNLNSRKVFLTGEVDDELAHKITTQFIYLYNLNSTEPIKLYINSPGGSVTSGLAIYDILREIGIVETICLGQAASMGAFLLASGVKGKRSAYPSARIMIHQPIGGAHGQATDIEIQANEILSTRQFLSKHLSHLTGKPLSEIELDCDRDYFMNPNQAIEYGIIDNIIKTDTGNIIVDTNNYLS